MNWVNWVIQFLQVVLALAAAPLLVGWVNKCRAWLQNRSAPSLLQPYRAIRKLFHKDAVIADEVGGHRGTGHPLTERLDHDVRDVRTHVDADLVAQ